MRGLRLHEARRARALRTGQTEAERKLWLQLRNRSLGGFKFVRQEPIGPYFADFVCREEKLIVEVDGATHSTDDERRRDEKREQALRATRATVWPASTMTKSTAASRVLETILAALERRQTL